MKGVVPVVRLVEADGVIARRGLAEEGVFDPREAAVAHEEQADARDHGERCARAQHEPALTDQVEQPAAQDGAERLPKAVDGAGYALQDGSVSVLGSVWVWVRVQLRV